MTFLGFFNLRTALALALCLTFVASTGVTRAFEPPDVPEHVQALFVERDHSLRVMPSLDQYFFRRGEQANDFGMQLFYDRHGHQWDVFWDTRSNRPELISGQGIPFIPGPGNDLISRCLYGQPAETLNKYTISDSPLRFIEDNPELLRVDPGILELYPEATRAVGKNNRLWFINFRQVHKNLLVKGAGVFFRINSGNITQMGAHQIVDIPADFSVKPAVSADRALDIAIDHALTAIDGSLDIVVPPELVILPTFGEGRDGLIGELYQGEPGKGYGVRLAYELTFRLDPYIETWFAVVDAQTGELLQFEDSNKYDSAVYGGVYLEDNLTPEAPAPFPYAQTDQGVATSGGRLDYPGGSVTCTLNGQFVQIGDNCGSISLTSPDGDLNFGLSPDTNCSTPGFGGAGNTRASRTAFYHTNDIILKAKAYLPDNPWLQSNLLTNVNINNTCNAFWDGTSINFYREGSGCSNTGELSPVVYHEWGHGLDSNTSHTSPDSSSSEALADAMSILQLRVSCVGHNFRPGVPCGYGCDESCTGVRDAAIRPHARPDTIADEPYSCNCQSWYSGVLGYQGHCESHIASGAVWDMALLLADALGEDAGWAHANRLLFENVNETSAAYRLVSGGQCNPDAEVDGCGSRNWYTVWLFADDDNGNLADGTPNGCLIWDAFNDHGIACGDRPDCYSECPPIETPELVLVPGDARSTLSWEAVPNASYYLIFRNSAGCQYERSIIGTTSATSYTDDTVANDFIYYYSIQAVGTNDACRSGMSACLEVEPGLSSNGVISLDKPFYGHDDVIMITVGDLDLQGDGTLDITIESDSDPDGLTVTLNEAGGPTGIFEGSVNTTTNRQSGLLLIADGDEIRAIYFDEDIGDGTSEYKIAIAHGDLTPPEISNVSVANVTIDSFTVTWTTNEPADSVLVWDDTIPPDHSIEKTDMTTEHQITVSGLEPCAEYFFAVQSTDIAGNTAYSDNNGAFYSLTTLELMVLLEENMDTDPGWTYENLWEWGPASGQGGNPPAGHTGTHIVGYNLTGNYQNNLPPTYMTTTSFDCSDANEAFLSFWRWLCVESATWDHASIEISNDGGSSWHVVWAHSGGTIQETSWSYQEYDISNWAAGHNDVTLRWVMGPSDSIIAYCGWNIDDVMVSYTTECVPPTPTPAPPTATPTATPTSPPPTNTPAPPTATPTPDCINHGDVNFDGVITAEDAQITFQIAIGQHIPTYEEECAADCNGDGVVSAADAQLVFLTAIGAGECADPMGNRISGADLIQVYQAPEMVLDINSNLIRVENVTGYMDDTVSVDIWLNNTTTPVDAFTLNIGFDHTRLDLLDLVPGDLNPDWTEFGWNVTEDGIVTVAAYTIGIDLLDQIAAGSEGVLFSMTFALQADTDNTAVELLSLHDDLQEFVAL